MDAKKIPVVKVGRAGVAGAPEEFERHFERRRQPRSVAERRPMLRAIENKSLSERMQELGINES